MNSPDSNIQFNYEYRDAGNNHQWGYIVFANSNQIVDLSPIEELIRKDLFDDEYFYPYKLEVPLLHFEKWDHQLDHDWYRFLDLEFTDNPVSDQRTFNEFLLDIEKFAKKIDI